MISLRYVAKDLEILRNLPQLGNPSQLPQLGNPAQHTAIQDENKKIPPTDTDGI